MKQLFLLALILLKVPVIAQSKSNKLIGSYSDYFGNQIKFNTDSTFSYSWHFDLASSWSEGTWRLQNDTLYLKIVPIYDTIKQKRPDGKIVDSLVLSDDKKAEVISTVNTLGAISAGGQNRNPCPDKLLFRKEKLFTIDKKGKPIKKKIRGFLTTKKWEPWYFKQDEK